MNKLFTLALILLITTVTGFPQRNDGGRNGYGDSGRNPKIERERGGTGPVINLNNPQRDRRNDSQTIVYPKTPIQPDFINSNIPIEGECIVNLTILSSDRYNSERPSSIQIAMHLFNLGDYYEASLKFTEWLVNNPKDIDALYHRGICYYEIDWYGFAIEDFNLVIGMDSVHAEAYYYRGLSNFLRGEKALARIDLDIAFELDVKEAGVILKKYF